MHVKSSFVVFAGLLGAYASAGLQDPTFDFRFAAPELAPEQATPVIVSKPAQPTVTARFRSAKVGDVLAWLERQNVNFIAAESDLPLQTRVSINLVDQPLDQVLSAIGEALKGHWIRRGNIHVFRSGGASALPFSATTAPGDFQVYAPTARGMADRPRPSAPAATPAAPAVDLRSLVSSLSPAQIEKHRKQGFLTPEDLTPAQRKMLGDQLSKGSFELKYSSGRSVFVFRGS
jgi:hypothetical protein